MSCTQVLAHAFKLRLVMFMLEVDTFKGACLLVELEALMIFMSS
jgi:hypothetical protein